MKGFIRLSEEKRQGCHILGRLEGRLLPFVTLALSIDWKSCWLDLYVGAGGFRSRCPLPDSNTERTVSGVSTAPHPVINELPQQVYMSVLSPHRSWMNTPTKTYLEVTEGSSFAHAMLIFTRKGHRLALSPDDSVFRAMACLFLFCTKACLTPIQCQEIVLREKSQIWLSCLAALL